MYEAAFVFIAYIVGLIIFCAIGEFLCKTILAPWITRFEDWLRSP